MDHREGRRGNIAKLETKIAAITIELDREKLGHGALAVLRANRAARPQPQVPPNFELDLVGRQQLY